MYLKIKSLVRKTVNFSTGVMLSTLVWAESALAVKNNAKALKAMSDTSKTIFQGDLLNIAINAGGFAAIVYALLGGLKIGPLVAGIGLLIFNALWQAYTGSYFG